MTYMFMMHLRLQFGSDPDQVPPLRHSLLSSPPDIAYPVLQLYDALEPASVDATVTTPFCGSLSSTQETAA